MTQRSRSNSQGHSPDCCPADECGFCNKPIEPGQGWARVTTTIYTPDHEALKEYWTDYHHDPAVYEALVRGQLDAVEDRIRGGSPGACFWHGEDLVQ